MGVDGSSFNPTDELATQCTDWEIPDKSGSAVRNPDRSGQADCTYEQ